MTNPPGVFPADSFKDSPLEHVRSLFLRFFQGLFSAAPRGAYHWSPSDEDSEIFISNENPINAETVGQRPAITCTRGPVQFYSLGLDDMLNYSFRTGTKQKTILVPGTMTVNCCSREALESERIAWICAEQLWMHREMLMRQGFFEIGRLTGIGSPSPAGSLVVADMGVEWYVSSITYPFQFYRTSQASPLNQKIVQGIDIALSQRTSPVSSQGPISYEGADPPFQVKTCPPEPFAPAASDALGNTPNPGAEAPHLPIVPHPLNPSKQVVIRSHRPNSPAVKPPSIGGRAIPIVQTRVEESCRNSTNAPVLRTSTVKV